MKFVNRRCSIYSFTVLAVSIFLFGCSQHLTRLTQSKIVVADSLKAGFLSPPPSAKPGVYWYFMDGNRNKPSITKDLESMKAAGIGSVIYLEVNVGVPRGNVDLLSDEWIDEFAFAVSEARRLGIQISLGTGPGWAGSGGPWVSGSESMQHLVASTTYVSGGAKKELHLPVPEPRKPYFGEEGYTPELHLKHEAFYQDVAVLAFPTPATQGKIADIDEKAMYIRPPYSSGENVKQYLTPWNDAQLPVTAAIPQEKVIDLTSKMSPYGTLTWDIPPGNWTIMRFGARNNGMITRPAPMPGLGLEVNKMDTTALNHHLDNYIGKLLKKTGEPDSNLYGGLKRLHIDSWEMGAQNWTPDFRNEFKQRRGYDPLPFYPVYEGNIIGSQEISERFLWDLRKTTQELILDYHAKHVKTYAHKHGMGLSIEPYDMNPSGDLELGSIADVPMAEFWSTGMGFNTSFSLAEATSIAHVMARDVVQAESFTALDTEGWKQYPGSMKEEGDWAFAAGVNRFFYHTFASQVLPDSLKPGMTMGPFGVHWNRSQTWWPMVVDYHRYIARCQFMLQQGRTIADILFLTPEEVPYVFRPPYSALTGQEPTRDRRGYNFDGCSPGQLLTATVKDGAVTFQGGASYKILVLPDSKTMTPALLTKIRSLAIAGATIIGLPPLRSPGLTGYPATDGNVKKLAEELWGINPDTNREQVRAISKGKIIFGGQELSKMDDRYPSYEAIAKQLLKMGVPEDFSTTGQVRYTHRCTGQQDIYFLSNKLNRKQQAECLFRTTKGTPELWNPVTGTFKELTDFKIENGETAIPLEFDSYESCFIVFDQSKPIAKSESKTNFADAQFLSQLSGKWDVSFDPKWGGPQHITFDTLKDWTKMPEPGIKYYSGIATYTMEFDLPKSNILKRGRLFLDLGQVKNLARVTLNGKLLGVVWTAPWQIDITDALKSKENKLEIEVANLWPNRLIGDELKPDDGIKDGKWPDWLLKGGKRTSGRFTFTTFRHYTKDSPLLSSGLLGPVTILQRAE